MWSTTDRVTGTDVTVAGDSTLDSETIRLLGERLSQQMDMDVMKSITDNSYGNTFNTGSSSPSNTEQITALQEKVEKLEAQIDRLITQVAPEMIV